MRISDWSSDVCSSDLMLLSDIPANLDIGLDPMNYFPVGDVAELTARLNADCADFEVDRDTVRARFSWDRAAADTLEVYRAALAPRRPVARPSVTPGTARDRKSTRLNSSH